MNLLPSWTIQRKTRLPSRIVFFQKVPETFILNTSTRVSSRSSCDLDSMQVAHLPLWLLWSVKTDPFPQKKLVDHKNSGSPKQHPAVCLDVQERIGPNSGEMFVGRKHGSQAVKVNQKKQDQNWLVKCRTTFKRIFLFDKGQFKHQAFALGTQIRRDFRRQNPMITTNVVPLLRSFLGVGAVLFDACLANCSSLDAAISWPTIFRMKT